MHHGLQYATMNGLEAMHHIRKLEAHTGLPIFILTTESAKSRSG